MTHIFNAAAGRVMFGASLALAVCCPAASFAQTNLIVNGSFEEPAISGPFAQRTSAAPFGGWFVDAIGQGVVHVGSYGTPSSIAGEQSIELNWFSSGGIYQTIATTPGSMYTISFLMAGQLNAGPDLKQIRVDFGGTTAGLASWSRSGSGGQWVAHSFVVTATGSSTVVHFLGITPANEDGGPYIDDVRVLCVGVAQQPAAAFACTGGTATLSIVPAGDGPFGYQWRRAGVPINTAANPSAATATLVLSNVQPADAVAYDCIVTGSCGTIISNATELTLVAAVPCSLADIVGTAGGPIQCGDSVVDGSDFIAFINSFGTGDPAIDPLADVAGGGADGLRPDGVIDGSDFIAFINAFAEGC
jgi:hypothetical protein